MENLRGTKLLILKKIINLLDEKVATLVHDIASVKESRNADTKNSAGDKYETGRAMMEMELEKNEIQLHKTLLLKKEMVRIDSQMHYDKVAFGSLVITTQGNYLISVAMGKLEINNEIYYTISLASPIGQALQGKTKGDSVEFQNRNFTILDII